MQPGSAWLQSGCLRVKALNRVRRPLRCLDRRLSWLASSSSMRTAADLVSDSESGNPRKASGDANPAAIWYYGAAVVFFVTPNW